MSPYLDASVLTALALTEPTGSRIAGWLTRSKGQSAPVVSDFARGEMASGIARRIRTREISLQSAQDALILLDALIASYRVVTITPPDIELARSFVLRFELGLRLPDAIHIAVAQRLGATLVTLDKQQLAGAVSLGIAAADPLA